jgi:hypothetical protein
MKRAAWRALALVAAAGCVSTSQIGPYVKHVERNGDWLVIHKCIIVLEGDELAERSCTYEQLPLRQVPLGPPPPVSGPPGAPQGTPMPAR